MYTTCVLVYNIYTKYNYTLVELMRTSPRFAVMLLAMLISIVFTIVDICAVTDQFNASIPIGINPFWKMAFVFKLLTDSVILDDFKTALDRLSKNNISTFAELPWVSSDAASGKRGSEHREILSRSVCSRSDGAEFLTGIPEDRDCVGNSGIEASTNVNLATPPCAHKR